MCIELVIPSSHLILCHPLLLLPPIPPSFRVFSNESTLCMRWPKYWSLSLSISPSNEHPGLVSFRMDWLDLLAVQGTHKSLLQHHSSKASILWRSAFFTVQLSHPYMTTGKTIALTRCTYIQNIKLLEKNLWIYDKAKFLDLTPKVWTMKGKYWQNGPYQNSMLLLCKRPYFKGPPWWLSGKESACQCRRHQFNPWPRKIPHVAEQLNSCTTTMELVLESPGATTTEPMFVPQLLKPARPRVPAQQQEKPSKWEIQALQLESSPLCN